MYPVLQHGLLGPIVSNWRVHAMWVQTVTHFQHKKQVNVTKS